MPAGLVSLHLETLGEHVISWPHCKYMRV